MKLKRIGLLGFDGVQALDLTGPAEAFAAATVEENGDGPQRCYEVIVIGLTSKPFVSADCHLIYKPHKTIHTAPPLDTLIIAGGPGLREPETNAKVSTWVKSSASHIRRIATVCTGTYGLAATGLWDGRTVTTHWRNARDFAARFPKVKVDPNALYLKDGNFYTSAGLTAGMDLSLALIEEDFGSRVALAVARELVVYLKRPGGQEQYSEPLKFQTRSSDAFAELVGWMTGHLHHDLSVEALAAKACLGPRQFSPLQKLFRHDARGVRRKPATGRSSAASDDAKPEYRERGGLGRLQERRCISPSIRAPLWHHSRKLSKAFQSSIEMNVRKRRQLVLHIRLVSGI